MPTQALPAPPASQPLRFLNAYWRLWQALAARAEGQLSQQHGLDLRAFMALAYLQGGVSSPGELATQLGLPRYVVTRTLDALSRLEAVQRVTDGHDARRQQVNVTPAGRALWEAALQTTVSVCEGPLSALGPRLDALTALLEELGGAASGLSFPTRTQNFKEQTP
jgi:DNA-binding MarR family transcriptional regulator